MTSGEFLLK